MINSDKIKTYYLFSYIFIVAVLIIASFSVLNFLEEYKRDHRDFLFETSKTHFSNIINSRAWNAKYGGVYVYQKEGINPNPYLQDNHTYDKNNELLVKINPAWMTRMLSELENSKDYRFGITSLKPINPINAPDDFETKALTYLQANPNEKFYSEMKEESDEYKFLGKLSVTKACMKCHEEQGYKIGDIRGGISVTLNAKNAYGLLNFLSVMEYVVVLATFIIAFISGYMIRYVYRHQKFVANQNIRLESKVQMRTQELERAKRDAENANRLKGEFLSNVTHEIRTPLNAILSMSKLAMNELQLQDKNLLTSINKAGNDLNVLVQNIIDYSKLEAGVLELRVNAFSVKKLIRDVESFVSQKALLKEVKIEYGVDANVPPFLSGDAQRVQQVLNQLMDNAVKFTPSGGNVKLSVTLVSLDKSQTRLSFSVSDTGVGIEKEDQKTLFKEVMQLDQRLHRKFSGIGLGLIFCKKLVTTLKGSISLKSEINKGTIVMVELPFGIDETLEIDEDVNLDVQRVNESSSLNSDIKPSRECIEMLHLLKTELNADYSKSIETLKKIQSLSNNTNIQEDVSKMAQKINIFEIDGAIAIIDGSILKTVSKDAQ